MSEQNPFSDPPVEDAPPVEAEVLNAACPCCCGSHVARRTLLWGGVGLVGVGYVGAVAYPLYRYLNGAAEQAAEQSSATVTEMAVPGAEDIPPGGSTIFLFGTAKVLLIHHPDGTWSAFSAICTHMGCTVEYQNAKNRIFCNCHHGVYNDETGEPVSGPPPRPLAKYNVEEKDGKIFVSST